MQLHGGHLLSPARVNWLQCRPGRDEGGLMQGQRANPTPWEPTGTNESQTSRLPGADNRGPEAKFLTMSSQRIRKCEVRPSLRRLEVSLCSNQLAHERKDT